MAIRDKLDISQVVQLKRMGKSIGLAYAKEHYPQLEVEELSELESLWPEMAGPIPAQTSIDYDPHRPLFITVAWLLGASQAQLGRFFGVSQQTILKKLDRTLRYESNRMSGRIVNPPLPAELLEAMHGLFYKLLASKPDVYNGMTPHEIARALSNVKFESGNTPEQAYSELPDVKDRVNG